MINLGFLYWKNNKVLPKQRSFNFNITLCEKNQYGVVVHINRYQVKKNCTCLHVSDIYITDSTYINRRLCCYVSHFNYNSEEHEEHKK